MCVLLSGPPRLCADVKSTPALIVVYWLVGNRAFQLLHSAGNARLQVQHSLIGLCMTHSFLRVSKQWDHILQVNVTAAAGTAPELAGSVVVRSALSRPALLCRIALLHRFIPFLCSVAFTSSLQSSSLQHDLRLILLLCRSAQQSTNRLPGPTHGALSRSLRLLTTSLPATPSREGQTTPAPPQRPSSYELRS